MKAAFDTGRASARPVFVRLVIPEAHRAADLRCGDGRS